MELGWRNVAGILARLPGQVLFIAWTTAMLGQGGGWNFVNKHGDGYKIQCYL